MTDYGVRLDIHNRIAIVTLNRPDRQNAFNEAMWSSFESVTDRLRTDMPRAVVITGAGNGAFCAGFDVNPDNPQVERLAKAIETGEPRPIEELIRRIRTAVDRLVSLPVPIIAAVNGLAYGGGAELAVQCDMRVIDPKAVFCFSEVKLGLMPDWGGGVALTRLAGPSTAAELILSAKKINADESLAKGLANRISPPGKSLDEAVSIARAIAKNGPRAVQAALRVIRDSRDLPIRQALQLEEKEAARLIASGECIHGISAFLAKQSPNFPDS